jgi:hypothetical protein
VSLFNSSSAWKRKQESNFEKERRLWWRQDEDIVPTNRKLVVVDHFLRLIFTPASQTLLNNLFFGCQFLFFDHSLFICSISRAFLI